MINDQIGARFQVSGMSYDYDQTLDGETYNLSWKPFSVAALVDYRPFQNAFFLSGGVYLNNNKIEGSYSPAPGETFSFGDHEYDSSQIASVDAKIDWENTISPYVGFGWGYNSEAKGFGMSLEIGALYQGSTQISATPNIAAGVSEAMRNQITQDIKKETSNIENDIKDYTWYPVISIGFTYAF